MISLWKTLGGNELPVEKSKILFVGEEISFASRYRVEHFREQLILNGYASKFIQMDQAEQEKIEEYTAVVMYRCSKTDGSGNAGRPGKSCQNSCLL